MLIIQIALGIVLGFLILRFLPQIIALGGYLLLAAIVLAVIGFGVYFVAENPKTVVELLVMVGFLVLFLYAICLFGVLVQNLPALRKISEKERKALKDIKEPSSFIRYNIYLFDRFGIGFAAMFIFFILAGISSLFLGGMESPTIYITPLLFFGFLALLRYGEIRKEKNQLSSGNRS